MVWQIDLLGSKMITNVIDHPDSKLTTNVVDFYLFPMFLGSATLPPDLHLRYEHRCTQQANLTLGVVGYTLK